MSKNELRAKQTNTNRDSPVVVVFVVCCLLYRLAAMVEERMMMVMRKVQFFPQEFIISGVLLGR